MSRISKFIDSPVGRIRLVAEDGALCGVYLPDHKREPQDPREVRDDEPVLVAAANQLAEYFRGERTTFDLPLRAQGTPFQQKVWSKLREIPFGAKSSYLALAQAVANPAACRAVGAANGRNPISIIVPCHRVVGSDGSLTGYAGGASVKRWLLDHEERVAGAAG